MSEFPLDPQLAKMLVTAPEFRCRTARTATLPPLPPRVPCAWAVRVLLRVRSCDGRPPRTRRPRSSVTGDEAGRVGPAPEGKLPRREGRPPACRDVWPRPARAEAAALEAACGCAALWLGPLLPQTHHPPAKQAPRLDPD